MNQLFSHFGKNTKTLGKQTKVTLGISKYTCIELSAVQNPMCNLNSKLMKKYLILLVGVVLMIASCNRDNLDNEFPLSQNKEETLKKTVLNFNTYAPVETPAVSSKSDNANLVTKKIVFYPSSGTFGVVVNPGYCPDLDPPLQMVIAGGGNATHLGTYTVENLACVDVDGNFLSPILGFITAANGDVIYTQMGAPYPDLDNPPNLYYPYVILGGSAGGRFDGATGSITMYGTVDYATGTWTLSGEGEITY